MANNYCESSSMLEIPESKIEQARAIYEQIVAEYEENEEEGYFGVAVTIDDAGVWMRHEESINPDHVAVLAQALVDGLDIDEPFQFSWSYTCSKPRIDEFGGGSCIIRKGKDPIWVDAASEAQNKLKAANAV